MGLTAQYRGPDDLPKRIPVFPLRGTILLPRASLPLNIFEPRYLTMLDDALASDRIVGIIQPAQTADEGESPRGKSAPLREIGCAGRITSYQEVEDGRRLITLTGIARFEVTAELASTTPYRICQITAERFVDDFETGHGEADVDRPALLDVLKRYLEANHLNADWTAINRATTEFLVNSLSLMSPYGPEEKQALLEAIDLAKRAEVLIALARMERAKPDDGSGSAIQ
ncbi:MAG: LON peptidase substrate-binding domain-containing protein [Hyphomicrobiaceae bacterium]|nr:LON peptidase substrate-binding domain-containing protein [Hyphomicrobiaceae bacterium]